MDITITGDVTWAAAVQAAASLVGFGVIGYQVIQLRKNIRGATQDRLYAHYNDIVKLIFEKSHLYPYFYKQKIHSPSQTLEGKKLTLELELMCEAICGVLEHCCLQRQNMPPESWANCWLSYTEERVRQSPALVAYFRKNNAWYTNEFTAVINDILEKIENER